MKNYDVRWSKQARTYFSRLDRTTKERISIHVDWLATDPDSSTLDVKPLEGFLDVFRLRIGKYRLIYKREDEIKIIGITYLGSRGEIYKIIKR